MKYEITKDQILELAKIDVNQYQLKEWFPDAFKKELEVWKWYKRPHNSALFYVTEILNIDSNYCKIFGFDNLGNWMAENAKTFPDNDFEATPKQVETALINEAKKRGFKKGVQHTVTNGDQIIMASGERFGFHEYFNKLLFDNWSIFESGIWAEILPQEKTVVPMGKALKIIAKKMKVSPENIEIKS